MLNRLIQPIASLVLLIIGLMGPMMAGDHHPSTSSPLQYRVTSWTAANGLPQNTVKALLQTRDGYLWIGTLKGLARFDGVRFKIFDHSTTTEMAHDSINGLAEDKLDGSLWIQAGTGLLRYREHQFKRFGPNEGIQNIVGPIWPSSEGGLWFSSRRGHVGLLRDERVTNWEFGPDALENQITQVTDDEGSSKLLLLRNYSLQRLNLDSRAMEFLSFPWTSLPCSAFLREADGMLWCCTANGIWHGTETNWTHVLKKEPSRWPVFSQIYRMREGRLLVKQQDGAGGTLQRLVEHHLEPLDLRLNLNVSCFFEDRESNLWIGTTTGLHRLEPTRLTVYSDGLRNDEVQAVTSGSDGTIWVGTTEGVSVIREGVVTNLPLPPGEVRSGQVLTLLADSQNVLWVHTESGALMRYQEGAWETFPGPPGLQLPGRLKTFYEDKEHRIWIGTGNGALCHDHGQWMSISKNDGLSHPDVRVIYQDRRGDLWFGTYGGGLNRLHDGKLTAFATRLGNYNNRAWWIHEDAEGVFWVGSEDGLNRFVPPGVQEAKVQSLKTEVEGQGAGDRFSTFTTKHGLGENVVNNIQEDDFGYLWLSGLHGIYRVSRQQLNEVAAGKRAEVECIAFGEADGMLNSECNGGDNQPAGCKDPRGQVWFPTTKGVVVIDPAQIHRNEIPPPVVIEQVKANEEVIYGDGTTENQKSESRNQKSEMGIRIAPGGARVLEIQYTANSLVAPEKVRFKYRLEGYDGHWRDAGDRRVAFYTNLRPGNYRFELKACNHHGVWSQLPASFAFTVAPHFYETGPFYGLCAASAVMAAFGLHHRRVRVLRRIDRLERAQALQTERARIARDLHDDLGANLTGIALKADLAQRQLTGAQGNSGPLADIATSTRGLVDQMRETVWALNPKNDTLERLARFLAQQVEHYATSAELRCRLDLPDRFPVIEVPSPIRHHLCLAVKEAVHNAVKHAGASEIHFALEMDKEMLCLRLADDGQGFEINGSHSVVFEQQRAGGNGLKNMRQRVLDLGGTLQLDTAPGRGTRLTIRIPTKAPADDKA